MQPDILLQQLLFSLEVLKKNIDAFEKQTAPHVNHAEKLYSSVSDSHKLISAFLVLKQQQDISPDLNLHLKLMSIPVAEESQAIDVPIPETREEESFAKNTNETPVDIFLEQEKITKPASTNPNKIIVNINDKFRFVNELFKANVNEYSIAIEQLNAANTVDEINAYLMGLKTIYEWNEENEMVKKLFTISQKRFS